MAGLQLHCQRCGRAYALREAPGDKALYCGACGGPMADRPPSHPVLPGKDAFRGKTVGGAVLKSRLAACTTHGVYRAYHSGLRTNVRVKVYPVAVGERNPAYVRLLFGRAAVARGVRSMHVVALLDLGRLRDCYFIITEDIPAWLPELLESGRPLKVKRVLQITEGALRGLAALEQADAVHGDIRPETILIGYEGYAKLDHPGAPSPEQLNCLTVSDEGTVTGPALYVAPERALDERRADIRSDLYSLGAVAYHMLTGRPPYDAPSAQEVMAHHVEAPVPAARRLQPKLPGPVCSFVARLMAKSPADRPASAQAALDELLDCATQLNHVKGPTAAPPAQQRGSAIRWTATWTLVAVLLLAAFITPFVLLVRPDAPKAAAVPVAHKMLFAVDGGGVPPDALPPEQASALGALVSYRLSFYPALDLIDPASARRRLAATGSVEQAREEFGASHVLLIAHSSGFGRRNWTLIFANRGKVDWVLQKKCAIAEDAQDWTPLEEVLGDLLREAALRLGLEAARGAESVVGADVEGWAAMADAVRAEREDRWADALAALEEAAQRTAPCALLEAFYAAADRARETGRFRPTAELPQDGLTPQMAALAAVLRAMGEDDAPAVQQRFGAYLSEFPRSARGYYLLGMWRLHREGRREEALVAFRHAVRVDPGYLPAAHACVGLLARERPDALEAFLKEYEESVPDNGLAVAVRQHAERLLDQ